MKSFNDWLLSKITGYLNSKEGFITEEVEHTATGMKSIVRDAFGYRYEVHVKTLSRLQANNEDFNETFLKNDSLGFLENEANTAKSAK